MEATVTVKGRVVIPAQIRRRLGVTQGTRLRVEEHDGVIIMRPIGRNYFERMSGTVAGVSAVAFLEKSRREELRKEEATTHGKKWRSRQSPVTTLRELRGAVTLVGRGNFSAERAKAKSAVAKRHKPLHPLPDE